MRVLVPTGDMTAVRRTTQFFLNSFEERLVAQRKEREMATAELGFKKQLSKEERFEKKKQRLAAIAGSLVNLATMLHFNCLRMPATAAYILCAFFGLQVLVGVLKIKKLDQQERLITGTA
ncbi:hypothetical protein ZIOFF_018891 [Zingiber officinale]|uniref:Uncharacterized protein n=1 Tax=Zingiber officinale TaxID=94328 RepID=A0A8J5H6K6_ZINOF|nr:hypothetical protein ZIOFF_018891 [Zingiber officinale]